MSEFPYQYGYGYGGGAGDGLIFSAPLLTNLTLVRFIEGTITPPAAASVRIVEDHEGLLRRVNSGEIRFKGVRRVENLIGSSDYDGVWSDGITGDATITENANGSFTVATNGNGRALKTSPSINVVPGATYRVCLDLSDVSGTFVQVDWQAMLAISGTPSPTVIGPVISGSLTPTTFVDQRVSWSMTFNVAGSITVKVGVGVNNTVTKDITATLNNIQFEETSGSSVDAPNDYLRPETDFNVGNGVLGVQNFNTANGNTWNTTSGVVTEAAGAAIDSDAELVVNGTFDTDTTNWTPINSATLSVSSQRLQVTNGSFSLANQGIPTVIGRTYTVVVDVTIGTSSSYTISTSPNSDHSGSTNLETGASSGIKTNTFIATASTTFFGFGTNTAGAGETVFFDDISVKINSVIKGYFAEPQATNLITNPIDFTNASWAKVNGTVAADGESAPDGRDVADAFTATSANATVLDAITASSTANTGQIWLKRKTGTGTIEITLDGGSTFTTTVLTTAWQEFHVSQTLANPSFGVRIVTSGDAVYLWGGQVVASTNKSVLIPFSGTRAADNNLKYNIANVSTVPGFIEAEITVPWVNTGSPSADMFWLRAGSDANAGLMFHGSGEDALSSESAAGATTTASTLTYAAGETLTGRVRYSNGGSGTHNVSQQNAADTVEDDASPVTTFTAFGAVTNLEVLQTVPTNTDGSVGQGGSIKNIKLYNADLGDARLNPS